MKRLREWFTYLDENPGQLTMVLAISCAFGYGILLALVSADWIIHHGVPPLEIAGDKTQITPDLLAQRSMAKAAWWAVGTSLIVGVSSLLVSILVFLYSRQQSKHNERQERAYLRLNIHRLNNPIISELRVIIKYEIENVGQSLARNIEIQSDLHLTPIVPSQSVLQWPSEAVNSGLKMSVDDIKQGETVAYHLFLTYEEYESFQAGHQKLYMLGEIKYEDVFGNPCLLKFGFLLTQSSDEKLIFVPLKGHNNRTT